VLPKREYLESEKLTSKVPVKGEKKTFYFSGVGGDITDIDADKTKAKPQ
jgi:hypothetical protein